MRLTWTQTLMGFLLLTAYTSSIPTLQPPILLPTEQTDRAHAPIILRVEEREETQNGQLIIIKDIYFTDPDGDAIAIVNTLVATDPADFSATLGDDAITAPVNEQRRAALATSTMRCGSSLRQYSLTIEDRIRDAAGNLSEPVTVVFACPANPPNSIPFAIVALVIGAGLMVGLWLYFRKHPTEQSPSILSILLLLSALFPIYFMGSFFHESGHALTGLIVDGTFKTLYVHPFNFSGFSRPVIDNAWFHAGGYSAVFLISFLISLLFWKQCSVANLPFVLFFPYEAFSSGFLMLLLNGDIANILRLTDVPAILFIALGLVLLCLGILSFLSLLPLLGLNPADKKSLLVVPTAFYLHCVISTIIAHAVVPGSYIDNQYLLGADILQSANMIAVTLPILGGMLATIYITLYRWVYRKLPAGLRIETIGLTWKDLRLPAMLAAVSIMVGLFIIA